MALEDKENKSVVVGADTLALSGDIMMDTVPKIAIKNGVIVGYAGDYKWGSKSRNLIFKFLETEPFDLDAIELYLIENLKKYKISEDESLDVSLIMSYQDKMWWSSWDFCFTEILERYFAIGNGANCARGSLYSSLKFEKLFETRKSAEWHVELALDASSEHLIGINNRYTILSTEPKEKSNRGRPKLELDKIIN